MVTRRRAVELALGARATSTVVVPERFQPRIPAPQFEVESLKARKLPKPVVKYRRVTAAANLVGRSPLRILHLWVFENPGRLQNYLLGGWREFGHVHLLRQAGSVTARQYADAETLGGLGALFAESEAEVAAAIAGFDYRPDTKRFKRLKGFGVASTSVFDRYGSYPVNSSLCHSDVWRHALGVLLSQVDIVTMDLAGFTAQNQGSLYEMQRLMDTFPMTRVVWLMDPGSDVEYLEQHLREAWSGVADGSPNRNGREATARLVLTDYERTKRNDKGMDETELVATKKDARRILANLLAAGPT